MRYLLTGGAGYIGQALTHKLRAEEPAATIVLYDNSEQNLASAQQRFGNDNMRYVLGDVRQYDDLLGVLRKVDAVVHLAARKHVHFTNYSAGEAVATNIIGTMNLIKASLATEGVKRVVNVSSDKACLASTLYGSTKLVGEFLTRWGYLIGNYKTKFVSVRFGNVLGSSGSVLEIWRERAKAGKPLTVTNWDMKRFVMLGEQAADLICEAMLHPDSAGCVVVKTMPCTTLEMLFKAFDAAWGRQVVCERGLAVERKPSDPGEKVDEDLVSDQEVLYSKRYGDYILLGPPMGYSGEKTGFSTRNAPLMKPEELEAMVTKATFSATCQAPTR